MSAVTPYDSDDSKTTPLAERMDQSIGQATSMMGAVVTEMIRQALRGGVSQIGSHLQQYAGEQVDQAVAARLPEIERSAASAADRTARSSAQEVARQEVAVLEKQTQETALQLTDRLDRFDRTARTRADGVREELLGCLSEAALSAQRHNRQLHQELTARLDETHERTVQARQELTRQVEEAERRTDHARQELRSRIDETEQVVRQELTQKIDETEQVVRQELSNRIEETARVVREETTVVGRVLGERIVEVEKKAEEGTASTASALSAKIEETEKRVTEATSAEIGKHVHDLLESSRQATSKLKSRLIALEGTAGELGKALQTTETKLRGDLDRRLSRERGDLLERIEELLEANRELAARVAELEKPRGLRALWQRLFGKKKTAEPVEV